MTMEEVVVMCLLGRMVVLMGHLCNNIIFRVSVPLHTGCFFVPNRKKSYSGLGYVYLGQPEPRYTKIHLTLPRLTSFKLFFGGGD